MDSQLNPHAEKGAAVGCKPLRNGIDAQVRGSPSRIRDGINVVDDGEIKEGDFGSSATNAGSKATAKANSSDPNASSAANSNRPNMTDLFATAVPNQRQSPNLRKATQSLRWRNRYSQADLYPVQITPPGAPSDTTNPITYHVRQAQRGETDGTYGTGATVWPASMVLLKYLSHLSSKDPCILKEKSVCDLGAGTAVSSIAAALLGAKLVVCTDGNDHVIKFAEDTVRMVSDELTGAGLKKSSTSKSEATPVIGNCEVRVRKYWWGEDDESLLRELPARQVPTPTHEGASCSIGDREDQQQRYYDVIIVSDCVLPKLYPIEPLVRAISVLSGPDTVTYISYEHRYYLEYDPRLKFRALAELECLEIRIVPMEEQDPIYSTNDIEIWEVRRGSR